MSTVMITRRRDSLIDARMENKGAAQAYSDNLSPSQNHRLAASRLLAVMQHHGEFVGAQLENDTWVWVSMNTTSPVASRLTAE